MTDKLYCPWCGEELSNDFGVIFCYNEACKIHGCELNEQVIRDIIDSKKAQDALKVAIDALSKIDAFNCHSKGAMEVIAGMATIANRALYEITSTKHGK